MTLAVQVSGAVGTWEAVSGEVATFHLDKAYAPGAPITIEAALGDGVTVHAKAINSRKREGGFEVKAKLITVRRADRLRIEAHFQGRDQAAQTKSEPSE